MKIETEVDKSAFLYESLDERLDTWDAMKLWS